MSAKVPTYHERHRASEPHAVSEALMVVSYLLKISCVLPLFAVYVISSAAQCLTLAIWAKVSK